MSNLEVGLIGKVRRNWFDVVFTVTLVIAAAACQVNAFSATWSSIQGGLAVQQLPNRLGKFERRPEKFDISQTDLIRRTYCSGSRTIVVYARQSNSLDGIHDFRDCGLSNGINLNQHRTIVVQRSGQDNFVASEIKMDGPLLSLLWFQLGQNASIDRWGWRMNLLRHWKPNIICHELFIVTKRTKCYDEDLAALEAFAVELKNQIAAQDASQLKG